MYSAGTAARAAGSRGRRRGHVRGRRCAPDPAPSGRIAAPGRRRPAGRWRRRDEQRVEPQAALDRPGQRRTVEAQLPERDARDRQERDVDPHPLPEGARLLPGEPALLGRESPRRQERGQHEQRHAADPGHPCGDIGIQGDPRHDLEAHLGKWADDVEKAQGRDRQPRSDQHGGDGEQEPLGQGKEGHLRGRPWSAAGPCRSADGPPAARRSGRSHRRRPARAVR